MKNLRLHIIVDTREQQPWVFPDELAVVERGTLHAGDYALNGDSLFAIERKSLDDFLGTVSSGWDRFGRELERMAGHAARVVIVEGGIMRIVGGEHNHPCLTAKFIFKRIAQLTLHRVSVLFADNPVSAAGLAYSILRERSNETGLGMLGGGDRTGGATGPGMAIPEAGQRVDDLENVPAGIGQKIYRKRSSEIRATPRGSAEDGRELEEIGL